MDTERPIVTPGTVLDEAQVYVHVFTADRSYEDLRRVDRFERVPNGMSKVHLRIDDQPYSGVLRQTLCFCHNRLQAVIAKDTPQL